MIWWGCQGSSQPRIKWVIGRGGCTGGRPHWAVWSPPVGIPTRCRIQEDWRKSSSACPYTKCVRMTSRDLCWLVLEHFLQIFLPVSCPIWNRVYFVQVLILKLNKEAPLRRDVFRAPGHQGAMKKLIHFLQTGRLVNVDNYSVYTIASVLKKFLRCV